ncbi:hypothetical protein [Psychrobacter piscatorii]|uniref:hypothetical protein n=1 Tax=Psychrobacter piscatorii TaxID=554343 RepID=UPI001917F2A2|nr:hypothetical protein [Psychrobacter piscatorii]
MLGYCSNSPLRCENARSAKILTQVDSCCPECHLFLVPAQDITQQLLADEQFLRFSVLLIVLVLLIAVYVHYLHVT